MLEVAETAASNFHWREHIISPHDSLTGLRLSERYVHPFDLY